MYYVWAVVTPDGVPVVESVESDDASAISKFVAIRRDEEGGSLDWWSWQERGYRCERFALTKENGRER